MTTIVGVQALKGKKKGIVLGSDLNVTSTKFEDQGDAIYRQRTKFEAQKIYVADSRNFALSMAGVYDNFYVNFLSSLIGGEIDLEKATKEGFFPELRDLNLARWEGRIPNTNYLNSLLIATRFNNQPKLYTCFPMGKLEERTWTSIGSGSNYALKYIARQEKLIPKRLSLRKSVDLVSSSLEKASQDIYTAGMDLVIITPKKINEYGRTIRDNLREAKTRSIKEIKRSL